MRKKLKETTLDGYSSGLKSNFGRDQPIKSLAQVPKPKKPKEISWFMSNFLTNLVFVLGSCCLLRRNLYSSFPILFLRWIQLLRRFLWSAFWSEWRQFLCWWVWAIFRFWGSWCFTDFCHFNHLGFDILLGSLWLRHWHLSTWRCHWWCLVVVLERIGVSSHWWRQNPKVLLGVWRHCHGIGPRSHLHQRSVDLGGRSGCFDFSREFKRWKWLRTKAWKTSKAHFLAIAADTALFIWLSIIVARSSDEMMESGPVHHVLLPKWIPPKRKPIPLLNPWWWWWSPMCPWDPKPPPIRWPPPILCPPHSMASSHPAASSSMSASGHLN